MKRGSPDRWLSSEDAAREIGGVTPRWIRRQIELERLRARVLLTGVRPTYRIRESDLQAFRDRWISEDSHRFTDGRGDG